ncbi:MAG TPA: BamA/TamA family outer membrane protein [Firmicutes bacterium]|nr:BamA/TamA family outer membrane protein [Bacillota bacterium]
MRRFYRRLLPALFFFFLLFSCATAVQAGEKPGEPYRPRLEMEYIIPVIFYDGNLYSLIYGRMSSVLRDRELQFFLWADQGAGVFNYALGYTRHHYKWSTGINLYSMPVNIGPVWASGVWEEQTGLSLLATYRRTNETRFTFRLQWEKFFPLIVTSSFPEDPDEGSLLGWEVKAIKDDFSFLAQKGTRAYASLGGAFPFLNTGYSYIKIEEDWRRYYPLNHRVSAILSLRGGKIWGDHPSHRGFIIGGVQQANMSGLGNLVNQGSLWALADSTLRGYPLYQFSGDGFFLGNLEFRTLLYPSSYYDLKFFGLLGSVFFDAGQIYKGALAQSASPLAAWGVGLKLFFGGLLVGVDYAVPMDPGAKPCWHISLGEVF